MTIKILALLVSPFVIDSCGFLAAMSQFIPWIARWKSPNVGRYLFFRHYVTLRWYKRPIPMNSMTLQRFSATVDPRRLTFSDENAIQQALMVTLMSLFTVDEWPLVMLIVVVGGKDVIFRGGNQVCRWFGELFVLLPLLVAVLSGCLFVSEVMV